MDRQAYDNALRRQCLSLPALCEAQLEGARRGLDGLDEGLLERVRNVTLSGCGDSYFAARAGVPALKRYNNAFAATLKYERCIDAARFLALPEKYGSSTAIVGISASGSAARLCEMFRRARGSGYETLLITGKPDSPAGREAAQCLALHTPAFPNANPGLRNYYASLVGVYLFAARLGARKGICPADAEEALCAAIQEYTTAVGAVLEAVDAAMFERAVAWREAECFETVGDDICYATAQFIAAKFVETAGLLCPSNDAEDWCHVHYFGANPERRPLIVSAMVGANDRSRIGETINQAAGVGRPVLLIADAPARAFGVRYAVHECVLPAPPAGYSFLAPLLNHLPGSLLASYFAALHGEPYFRGDAFPATAMGTVHSEIQIV